MAKATELTPDALTMTSTPAAATRPRAIRSVMPAAQPANDTPLQIRVPRAEARAIKMAAAEADLSISAYLLSCFHARSGRAR